jgi:hypothetical protein
MKPIPRQVSDSNGWTVNYKFLERVQEQAAGLEDVSLEECEAVILTLVDLRFLELTDGE